jgi:hypothetical protein
MVMFFSEHHQWPSHIAGAGDELIRAFFSKARLHIIGHIFTTERYRASHASRSSAACTELG